MARVICGISNIPFKVSHIPMTLYNREYEHPIFHLPQKKLLGLYSVYTKGSLTDIDSYLLFLALLKSTDSVKFIVPAEITRDTPRLIANNISNLVNVIWSTNAIMHPGFKQPKFYIRKDTANLANINMWIHAWKQNIAEFKLGIDRSTEIEKLKVVENKLAKLIFTPEAGETRLAAAAADWADKAAGFPTAKRDKWKLIIRKCYNLESMFSTPKADLLEIQRFCEENIEAGSIQYHTLMKTIRTGIANHNDFLGLTNFSTSKTSDLGYTLLPNNTDKEEAALLSIVANAPKENPKPEDYPTKLAFLRAKLAYREALKLNTTNTSN